MRTKGVWPDTVTLRSGWAKAVARPWNDSVPDASLRLVRGSAEFLLECVEELCSLGVDRVLSPPLDPSQQSVWLDAGFTPELALDVWSRSLTLPVDAAVVDVGRGDTDDWRAAVAVDDEAFDDRWRMGALGLAEARDATPRSAFLAAHDDHGLIGFVIVGVAVSTAYLQRLAVAGRARGRGVGRSLVRAACRWGSSQGAFRIVLNTQPDNHPAARLYRSEGFTISPAALSVLGRGC